MSQHSARDTGPNNAPSEFDDSAVGVRGRPAEDESSPDLVAGATVGRYRLLCPIAAGGMAKVWAARPESGGLARTVAIKVVLPKFATDDEYARMFIDEAMVASAIHHPNICEIHELGREGPLLYMVLEWVAGDSLAGVMQHEGRLLPLPDNIGARVIADACSGLHAAHDALGQDGQPLGIVHRDISPPNILISLHGHVKVSDFGVAKARHQLHSRTRTGAIKGKFAYVPPEQILGKPVDRRADVYAMGCVLYVATLGWRPFGHGAKALGKIVQGKYPLPHELRADYPEGLEAIIVRALSADRERRYATAEDMRLELEQWLLTTGQPVVHADVARLLKDRISPERQKLIEAIRTWTRTSPADLASHFLAPRERMETPTADALLAKGVGTSPSLQPAPTPPDEHDHTVLDQRDAREIRSLMSLDADTKKKQGAKPQQGAKSSQDAVAKTSDAKPPSKPRDSVPTIRPGRQTAQAPLSRSERPSFRPGSPTGKTTPFPPSSRMRRHLRPYQIGMWVSFGLTTIAVVALTCYVVFAR